jgi:5-methylcytosine-specific restriction endonuclease McrA
MDKHRVHGVVCTAFMKLLSDKVLVINKGWQAIAETSVQEALCDCCAGKATAIDMETMRAVSWSEWIKLPIREGDRFIQSLRGPVRVPTVVGKFSYSKMPKRRPKLDNSGIARRDGKVCQVTGEYAPTGNVDHLTPRSRGGKVKSWSNMVWMRRDLNSKKGDKTLDEMGWKLIRTPHKPEDLEACRFIQPVYKDWEMFLPKQK